MQWRMCGGVLAAVGLVLAGASLPAAAAGPPLGAARSFAVLGGSTVMNMGPTVITGDLGVSPGTAITGFGPGVVMGGTIHSNDPTAMQAHADADVAYGVLAGMASLPANNLTGQDLGTLAPLPPGVYTFDTSAQLTGGLILDAQGDSNALFVFQIGSTLTTASGATVDVINGGADYDESNVFWQVGSSATLGSGTMFTGNILAFTSITLVIGSQMVGNALALGGAVTLDSNMVSSPVLVTTTTTTTTMPPGAGGPAAPSNLTALQIGGGACTATDLNWTDTSDNETAFRVYRRDGAGPDFVLIGAITTTDMLGTGGVVTYSDVLLDPSTPYTYRVTAVSFAVGESVPSNEVAVGTCAPSRWLDVHLGRRRSVIRDRYRARMDRVVVRGSYEVIDMDTSVPSVLNDADPRADGITIQVRAPGNLVLVSIPPNDPRWRVSRKGVYRWKTRNGSKVPASSIRIDTKKSEFTLKSERNEFGSVPVNSITVSLSTQSATGSETRDWVHQETIAAGTRAVFNLPR